MTDPTSNAATPRTDAKRKEIGAIFEPAGGNNLKRWYEFACELEASLLAADTRVAELRAQTLEEAAKVCDGIGDFLFGLTDRGEGYKHACQDCATAIRALTPPAQKPAAPSPELQELIRQAPDCVRALFSPPAQTQTDEQQDLGN